MAPYFRQCRPQAKRRVILRAHAFAPHTRLRLAHLVCAALLVMLSASAAMATPLATYSEQVRQAVIVLESLPEWKKADSPAVYTERVAAALRQVRETVLPIERVEWNDTTTVIDNKWLAEALLRYERIPAAQPAQRESELANITERLESLSDRLKELGGTAKSVSKDEEKRKLGEIMQRAEYNEKAAEGSALSRLWQRFLRWLRGLFPRSSGLSPTSSSALSGIGQIIIIGLLLAVVVYLLWKFTPVFRRGRGGSPREGREARVVLGERLEPDQTAADLLAQAEALARAGDLRGAIRKGYIALLCELGDRKIIGLAEHKTNRDYLRSVSQIEPLHANMQQLTRSFENHWYGFIPATESDWHSFRSGFQRIRHSDE